MKAAAAREYTLTKPMKLEPVDAKDFWPDLDGQLFFQDTSGDEISQIQIALKEQPMLMMAALLCKTLVIMDKDDPDAKPELMYQPTDRDAVAKLGGTVLLPVMIRLSTFLGLDASVIEALKKS